MELKNALQKIMEQDGSKGYMAYAQTYANYGLTLPEDSEDMRVQLLYVLSNLAYWRGETAREVKAVLKKHAKV